MSKRSFGFAIAAACIVLACAPAGADTIDFSQLGTNDTVFLGSAGGTTTDGVPYTIAENGFGFGVTVPGFTLLNEGNGWSGEFATGTPVLFDNYFNNPNFAAAVNIFADSGIASISSLAAEPFDLGPYTVTYVIADGVSVLTTITLDGNHTPGPEGTIPTLDYVPPDGDVITEITIVATNVANGMAIGGIGAGTVAVTPLPGTLPLFAGGLGFVGYLAKRRRQSTRQALAAT